MLRKITPNPEKARSILKMVDESIKMVESLDPIKFTSHVVKGYYEVIRELISVIALMEGYTTTGEGAHKDLIDFITKEYNEIDKHESILIDDLRVIRNRVSYDGFFVKPDYLERKRPYIKITIGKLKGIVTKWK